MPPAVEVAKVTKAAVALVDSGLTPGRAVGRRFHGAAAPLLLGSPRVDGFGMLPVTEHIRARHVFWGARLACALAQPLPPLWAVAARGALAPFSHLCHPLALLAWRPSPVECASLPASLLRLCDGLAPLPPVEDVSDEPLGLGAWCDTAPLWHNHLLPAAERPALAAEFLDLAGAGITTMGELASAAAAISEAVGRTEFLHALAVHLPHHTAASADHSRIRSRLHSCVGRLPPSWLVAALAGGPPPVIAFAALALPRLGWRFPDGPVPLQALSVRTATRAQLQRVGDQRQHRHARFVTSVGGGRWAGGRWIRGIVPNRRPCFGIYSPELFVAAPGCGGGAARVAAHNSGRSEGSRGGGQYSRSRRAWHLCAWGNVAVNEV